MSEYISREAAIEAIYEAFPECRNLGMAASALEDVPPAQQWIPVTKKLPVKRTWVLCKCRANIYEVLSWRDGEWYHDPQHRYLGSFVTHWIELPGPPKVEE